MPTPRFLQPVVNYFVSSKEELEKVSWPSKQDTIRYSALVIGVCVVMGAFFAFLDLGLNALVDATLASRAADRAAVETVDPAQTVVPDLQPVDATTASGTPVDIKPLAPKAPSASDLPNL